MTTTADLLNRVARQHNAGAGHNTLNTRTIELYFQRSPGVAQGDDRGIVGLEYRITSDGQEVARGTTASDGKIDVPLRPNTAMVLEIMHAGALQARYNLAINDNPFEPANTFLGVQRRLRQLGYQLGTAGPGHDGVDNQMGPRTDKAIQDFQVDAGMAFDSIAGDGTQRALSDEVGGSAQS